MIMIMMMIKSECDYDYRDASTVIPLKGTMYNYLTPLLSQVFKI